MFLLNLVYLIYLKIIKNFKLKNIDWQELATLSSYYQKK